MRTIDVVAAAALVAFAMVVGTVYACHARWRGRSHFERIERHGSSLVGKGAMEMGYWSLSGLGVALARRGVRPNYVSVASLITGLGAGVAVGVGDFGVAALAATASGFLDILDGMVARASGVASQAGEVLDVTIDRYTEYAFFAGLVLYYRSLAPVEVAVMLALAGSSLVTYSTAKADAFGIATTSALMRRHERTFFLVLGACLSAFTVPLWERGGVASTPLAVPMLAAVLLLAVVANVAAVLRMRAVALAVRR